MDNVHTLRNTHGADLVSLFVENGSFCGLAAVNASATNAFSVVSRSCATGNLSFAHELGHNFGALHDLYVSPQTSPDPHGHGYADIAGEWRTVMAYNNACVAAGTSCMRVAQFSNPDVSYAGAPTGTLATHDNARVHDERALTVANFRQLLALDGPIVTTLAATATSANGATVNGLVTSNGATTTVTFEYGTTAGYGISVTATQSPLPGSASGVAVSAPIINLVCNTLFHYRVVGSNASGTTSGSDLTFTTGACSTSPPAVTTNLASSTTAFSTTLNATASANGLSTNVAFDYGLTTAYGTTIAAAQNPLAAGAAGPARDGGPQRPHLQHRVPLSRARDEWGRERDRGRRSVHDCAVLERAAVHHDDRDQRQPDHHRGPRHDHGIRDRHDAHRHRRVPRQRRADTRVRRGAGAGHEPDHAHRRVRDLERCLRARIRSTPSTTATSATRRRSRRSCPWWW